MAAGPIGSVWKSGSWTDTCWTANTWADAGAPVASGEAGGYRYGYRMGCLVLALLLGVTVFASAGDGFIVRGLMTSTDQEAQEGYFAVGAELAIVTKPGSPIHDDLKRMVGKNVVIVVEAR